MTQPVTIPHLLEKNAAARPNRPAIHDKLTGSWRSKTWSEYNQLTREAGRALLGAGIGEGDVVAILGSNRPEWAIGALAAMRIGGVAAGIYTTCSPDEIAYVLRHAESKVLIAENLDQLAKVEEVWADVPDLIRVVLMDGTSDDQRVMSWDEFLASAEGTPDSEIDSRLEQLRDDQLAVFIYTSGTTGPPKAVMLTHENISWTAHTIGTPFGTDADVVSLSYLPLSHIAEMTGSILAAVTFSYTVYFCHDGLQLAEYLKEVRPTTIFGVPRVWERISAKIHDQFAEATGAKAKILTWAQGVGTKYTAAVNRGETPSAAVTAQYRLADKLVFSKLRTAIGFDRTTVFVSGAAPIPVSTLEFYASIGITIYEIYGQSEDTGPTTCNFPGQTRLGTVGRLFDGIEVKIGDDDEILVRGKNVFAGYYKDEAATAEALVDGWLHSGDLGKLEDGYLTIIGRKKDIIITSGGKNVAPQNIENALTSIDIVSNAVVIGEQQRFLIALLTLEPEASARFAEDHGLDETTLQ